jgi:hypothetical protein
MRPDAVLSGEHCRWVRRRACGAERCDAHAPGPLAALRLLLRALAADPAASAMPAAAERDPLAGPWMQLCAVALHWSGGAPAVGRRRRHAVMSLAGPCAAVVRVGAAPGLPGGRCAGQQAPPPHWHRTRAAPQHQSGRAAERQDPPLRHGRQIQALAWPGRRAQRIAEPRARPASPLCSAAQTAARHRRRSLLGAQGLVRSLLLCEARLQTALCLSRSIQRRRCCSAGARHAAHMCPMRGLAAISGRWRTRAAPPRPVLAAQRSSRVHLCRIAGARAA